MRLLLLILLLPQLSFSQKANVNFHIFEKDKQDITPVMVCITDLKDSVVIVPPDGDPAGPATFPKPFFEGIDYSRDRNWIGPIRMTNGKGGVNKERTYVYGMNPSLPYWNEPLMYQVTGDFSINLKPGKYRISIQHGNEYVPVTEEFTINAGETFINKSYLLERWIDLPALGWYSGDVHAHHALDKPLFKEYLLQLAKAEDVHLVNMLEMGDRQDTYFKSPSFGTNSASCEENYCLAFGQEDPRSDFGHVIGLNISAPARDTANYNYYDIPFGEIHKNPEALSGFAHFAYKGEGVTKGMAIYMPTQQVDFVELLQNTQVNRDDYYDYLNIGFRISAAAGSDFPWGSTIGDGRTYVYTGKYFSASAWFKGLKNGNTFVSNGPAVFLEVDKKIPGTEIKTGQGNKLTVHVKAFSNNKIGAINRVEVVNNDGLLLKQINTNALDSVVIDFSHTINKSQWICAVVYCNNVAIAHTSPVYIIADDKPLFDKQKGPAVVAKLQAILDSVLTEEKSKAHPDKGIMERAIKAKKYYQQLLQKFH